VKEVEDTEIAEIILCIQEQHYYSVGYRKMAVMVAKETGKTYGPKRVHRIMKENNLQSAVRIKKYSDEVYIRRKKMREAIPLDLIHRNFFAMEPHKRLIEDITYLPCMEQTMYLNTIEDLFNGEILAYTISDSIDTKLCTDAVKILAETIEDTEGVILHSDGGSTYLSYAYKDLVETQLHMIRSMGKTGSCYDNAPMESLNGIIKTECLYCRFGKSKVKNHMISRKYIIPAVTDYIEYYNTFRPKEGLGFFTPIEFRLMNPKGVYPAIIQG
jgi:transposase InsO family protein